MNLLSKLFGGGNQYDDERIVSQATTAIKTDPLINDDSAGVIVTSEEGVLTLSGVVHNAREIDRIEGVVRSSLTSKGLKFERLDNDLSES